MGFWDWLTGRDRDLERRDRETRIRMAGKECGEKKCRECGEMATHEFVTQERDDLGINHFWVKCRECKAAYELRIPLSTIIAASS